MQLQLNEDAVETVKKDLLVKTSWFLQLMLIIFLNWFSTSQQIASQTFSLSLGERVKKYNGMPHQP